MRPSLASAPRSAEGRQGAEVGAKRWLAGLLHSRNSLPDTSLKLAVVPVSRFAAVHSKFPADVKGFRVFRWQVVVECCAADIKDQNKGCGLHWLGLATGRFIPTMKIVCHQPMELSMAGG